MFPLISLFKIIKTYITNEQQNLIKKAYFFSSKVHNGQLRLSGEPYVIHLIEVAKILANMKMDYKSIITGLLHDSVEDTSITIDEIKKQFGEEIAFLVEGLTKLNKISFSSFEERQAENFRKMILAMSTDIRILIIKLADRFHNIKTLEYQNFEKQKTIAKETIDIYAPLANRLGINWMKIELEDLTFKVLNPITYKDLSKRIAFKKKQRDAYTEEVKNILHDEISKHNFNGYVEGRAKHIYSIYKKMVTQQINFDEIYDLIAFRIILISNQIRDCYATISLIHSMWKPVPGRFKDYIAMPKVNNYQSLHTTVIGPHGEKMEVQIRTNSMHKLAEEGIAAHWHYKEKNKLNFNDEEQIKKLRELFDFHKELKDPQEFMNNLKIVLFPDEVYVFTPKGDVKSFPKNATPIDFAYNIHTTIGNQCIYAKVNRNIVPLSYKLCNGDTIQIITQIGHKPNKDWLKFVVTSKAISKIKNFIKIEKTSKYFYSGKELLVKEIKKNHFKLKYNEIIKSHKFNKILENYSVNTLNELFNKIEYKKISIKSIIDKLTNIFTKKNNNISKIKQIKKKSKSFNFIEDKILTGFKDFMLKFSKCCNPLPNDKIIGYITHSNGLSIHHLYCSMIKKNLNSERIIYIHQLTDIKKIYQIDICVTCTDKKGLLAELSNAIASIDININYANVDANRENKIAICKFKFFINSFKELNKIYFTLKKNNNIISIEFMHEGKKIFPLQKLQ